MRRAYADARASRAESGSGDDVLEARLRSAGLAEVLEQNPTLETFVLGLWRRDVPPRPFDIELWKVIGQTTLGVLRARKPGAWQSAAVWLEMLPEPGRARVLLGPQPVGEVGVAQAIWERMHELAQQDLFADGLLDVRLHGAAVETGRLVAFHPGQ